MGTAQKTTTREHWMTQRAQFLAGVVQFGGGLGGAPDGFDDLDEPETHYLGGHRDGMRSFVRGAE